jgi:transcription-repair coupling factor (superfamily II helicase)
MILVRRESALPLRRMSNVAIVGGGVTGLVGWSPRLDPRHIPRHVRAALVAKSQSPVPAGIIESLVEAPAVQSLRQRVEQGGALSLAGVTAAAQPAIAALLQRWFPGRPLLIVTEALRVQEQFQQDLETWLSNAECGTANAEWNRKREFAGSEFRSPRSALRTHFFPDCEILPHEDKLPHLDVISDRLKTLMALADGRARLLSPGTRSETGGKQSGRSPALPIITNVVALTQRTFAPDELRRRMKSLAKNDRMDPLDLVEWLEDQGYEPEVQVNEPGQIALRGGIVDVYPPSSPWPVRLEFFGDELESLRFFDPIQQTSREEIEAVTVPPAGEFGLLKRATKDARPATLLDYLPPETIVLLCEPEKLAEHASQYAESMPDEHPLFAEWETLREDMAARGMTRLEISEVDSKSTPNGGQVCNLASAEASAVGGSETNTPEDLEALEPLDAIETGCKPVLPWTADSTDVVLPFQSLELYRPLGERAPDPQIAEAQRRQFFEQLHRWLRQGFAVHVFCNNDGERERFEEVWRDMWKGDIPVAQSGSAELAETGMSPLRTHIGSLARGFLFEPAKLVVVTDAEVFGRYKVQRPRRLKAAQAARTRSLLDIDFTELEEGDLVVHLQHGIGRYLGLKVLPAGQGRRGKSDAGDADSGQECLVIEYGSRDPAQPPPKLYVPITEAHLVSKYVGAGRARPPLHQLGGTRWGKAKEEAQRAVRDLAGEMLRIQAMRDSQPGFAFGPDTHWQREFEASFLYEETPDQMKAIVETRADLERAKPMDRLICGDVGYGKTEVAIRAAFKAVMAGKQVAILVPTTVLAQQHFNNFRERMSDYPVRVELLSRFRTRREQQKVIKDLAAGAVDIVIGTHRIVQTDIAFKDLGLVVIDEEQRFGVKHKEQFKLLRSLVDVLTLSATPIPRTLYLALTGARDMSTIETPPQDRLPVETIVSPFDERIVRDAIRRELNRQGQVFFLHNRVETIEAMGLRLKELVPEARLLIGHGQMDADELEEVMTRFVNGEADVLLCTTIIESGIDIPNANTIIIDRADRFGLAQLYQLRGRVGRYKHQAFAYLLIPRHARLLTDARKRIAALKQYSSLGSGFKIAMRDLEIRGAGNLLGAQQSGHITAVGFDLYCQLLAQSVATMKGERPKQRIEVAVRLDFLSMNPTACAIPASERASTERASKRSGNSVDEPLNISIPREVASYMSAEEVPDEPEAIDFEMGNACLPLGYIPDSGQRVEIYRRLASLMDLAGLETLRKELRDRFGPPPEPVVMLLTVAELKLMAAGRGISELEVRDSKVMLTRNGELLTLGGRFPRLTRREPAARLKELRKLLSAL